MGGEGLGFVFTDFLAVSGLGSTWSFARGSCRSFEMGAVVVGCVSRDMFRCPGICGGIAVSLSVGLIRRHICRGLGRA